MNGRRSEIWINQGKPAAMETKNKKSREEKKKKERWATLRV